MSPDEFRHRVKENVETPATVEAEQKRGQIRIAPRRHQMLEQDAFLKRGEGVDVLYVRRSAGNGSHEAIDLRLRQIDQRQHARRNRLGARGDSVRGSDDLPGGAAEALRAPRWSESKQPPHIRLQTLVRIRSMSVTASSEWPPSSKKLSFLPTRSNFNRSAHTSANARSASPFGA